jgi:hypothetical protein
VKKRKERKDQEKRKAAQTLEDGNTKRRRIENLAKLMLEAAAAAKK